MGLNRAIREARAASYHTSNRAPVRKPGFHPKKLEREFHRSASALMFAGTTTTEQALNRAMDALAPSIDGDFGGIDAFDDRVFRTMRSVIRKYNQVSEKEWWKSDLRPDEYETVAIFGILSSMLHKQMTSHNPADIGWEKYLIDIWIRSFVALKIATGNEAPSSGYGFAVQNFFEKLTLEGDSTQDHPVVTVDDDIAANEQIVSEAGFTGKPAFRSVIGSNGKKYLIRN